jgi:hypothetical protein
VTGLAIAAGYWLAAIAAFALAPWDRGRGRGVVRFLMVGAVAGVGLAATLAIAAVHPYEAVAGLLVYAFLCELFIFLFTLVGGSISVAILLRVYRRQPLRVRSERETKYGVTSRLDNMERTGLIARAGNRYSLTERGAALLRRARRLRWFFHQTGAD